jgi:hypothetical protein
MHHMDVMELTPAVSPARDFIDGAITIEVMKSCVGIGRQCPLELLQMLPWMFALAVL